LQLRDKTVVSELSPRLHHGVTGALHA